MNIIGNLEAAIVAAQVKNDPNVIGNLEATIVAAQGKNDPNVTVPKKYLAFIENDSNLLASIEALGLLTPLQWVDIYKHLAEQE